MFQIRLTPRGQLQEIKLESVIASPIRTRLDFATETRPITMFLDADDAIDLAVELLGKQTPENVVRKPEALKALQGFIGAWQRAAELGL